MHKNVVPFISKEETELPFYVRVIGGTENQRPENRPHGLHNGDYQWMHCVKGKGKLVIHGQEYILSPGEGCFLFPYVPHKYYGIETPWETNWITFNGSAVASLFKFIKPFEIFTITDIALIDKYFDEVLTAAQPSNPSRTLEASSRLYNFLIKATGLITSAVAGTRLSKNQQLQSVIAYIEKNYSKDITLDEMASLINVTPNYFCRLFKKHLLVRPFEYITTYRLHKAKEMLTGLNSIFIKEIAEGVGYKDFSYFCSIFKEHEGMTPMEYKKLWETHE